MTITEKKKLMLLKIEKARTILSNNLENGFISENDLINLLTADKNYGLKTKNKHYSYKKSLLISIFNSPFVLCDQENLSLNVKQILPLFLNSRYDMELEQLNLYYNQGDMSEEEYSEEKKLLKYCYYGSSIEGKSILKNGHVHSVLDNTVKVR